MFRHLFNFHRLKEFVSVFGLPDTTNCSIDISLNENIYQAVHNNCEIIDHNDNWSQLGFLVAFTCRTRSLQLIKALKPPEIY